MKAAYLAGYDNKEFKKKSKEILVKIGLLFQIQDDFIDCFGDSGHTGKIGTDIEEGKCCWPIVTALELCNESQKHILKTNYGLKSKVNVKAVKDVYNEINLIDVYRKEEEERYEEICLGIDEIRKKDINIPQILKYFLSKVYKRIK